MAFNSSRFLYFSPSGTGDGIGPEVIDQAVKVSDAVAKKFNHEIEWRSAMSGKVKVIETNANGCMGDTVYLETSFKTISGIHPLSSSLNIYPNPVTNVLYITGLDHAGGSIEFYSLLGKMMFRTNLSSEVNVEVLEKGVYYMRVRDENKQVVLNRKIIKK